MEYFIGVIIIITFIFLLAKTGAEEGRKNLSERNFENKDHISWETKNSIRQEIGERYEKICREIIEKHRYALSVERKKYLSKDPYGNKEDSGWGILESTDNKDYGGVQYFIIKVIDPIIEDQFETPTFADSYYKNSSHGVRWYAEECFLNCVISLDEKTKYHEQTQYWIEEVINQVCDEIDSLPTNKNTDQMDGVEYEDYCKEILEDAGWEVEDTPTTGDQGVDLIASIEDIRVCIQCKCFEKPVGNKAVQEVAAGKIHWNGTHAVVVGKSGFTKSAQTLAKSTKVILTSDFELKDLENLVL